MKAGASIMPDSAKWADKKFVRTSEWCGSDCKLFNGIAPTDVSQGEIGDCWVLSAIQALAEWPDRVTKIFD